MKEIETTPKMTTLYLYFLEYSRKTKGYRLRRESCQALEGDYCFTFTGGQAPRGIKQMFISRKQIGEPLGMHGNAVALLTPNNALAAKCLADGMEKQIHKKQQEIKTLQCRIRFLRPDAAPQRKQGA